MYFVQIVDVSVSKRGIPKKKFKHRIEIVQAKHCTEVTRGAEGMYVKTTLFNKSSDPLQIEYVKIDKSTFTST